MAGGSIFKINPDVMSSMMAGTKTGNEFEDMIALNNIAIKASGNIDELTFELKKKLEKKLKETQLLFEQAKEVYESLAKEMGVSNINEFKQKIKEYEVTSKKITEDSNKAKAELFNIFKAMQSQKLMFTGAKGNDDIKALLEMMESEEKFYILYNKRFNAIKTSAENRVKELDELGKSQPLTKGQQTDYNKAKAKISLIGAGSQYAENLRSIGIQKEQSIHGASTALSDVQKYTTEIVDLQTQISKLNGTNITFIDSIKNIGTEFSKNMLYVRLFGRGLQDIVSILKSFKEYEDLSLSVGMAGGLNLDQINEYRNGVLRMAQSVKFSASEIMKAQDLVLKTGYNLADSQKIVAAAMNVSRVTFEDLEKVTDLLNKTMLALDMSSMTSAKSSQVLYSAIQSTPLSIDSLGVALRQTGSAFGAVIEMTSKSGQALEDYKETTFETMTALSGALALMGKHIAHVKVA